MPTTSRTYSLRLRTTNTPRDPHMGEPISHTREVSVELMRVMAEREAHQEMREDGVCLRLPKRKAPKKSKCKAAKGRVHSHKVEKKRLCVKWRWMCDMAREVEKQGEESEGNKGAGHTPRNEDSSGSAAGMQQDRKKIAINWGEMVRRADEFQSEQGKCQR